MNLEFYRRIAETNEWLLIAPELCLALLSLGLLLLDAFTRKRPGRDPISAVAVWAQVVLLFGFLFILGTVKHPTVEAFGGMIAFSDHGHIMRLFFLLCSIIVCYMGRAYMRRRGVVKAEFYVMTIVVTAALMLLAQSAHFVMMFVALETVTIGLYAMVSYMRSSPLSLEAGLKYLILGGLSSPLLLFGIVLLYGVGGNPEIAGAVREPMSFWQLGMFLGVGENADLLLVRVGAAMVVAGLAFKIGAVPFQIWIPDVYQGAPTPVAAFLAVASKAGGFIILLNLVLGPFAHLREFLVPLLGAIAIVTILFGNLAAMTQQNTKRLMGLSGVAHAGYLLIGIIACFYVEWAPVAVLFYLFTYLFASFAVFGVMNVLPPTDDTRQDTIDYEDLFLRRPFLGVVLIIGLGSLAGIPPLAGFIGKFLIFLAAFQAGADLYPLLVVAIIGVVLSIVYYFGWMRSALEEYHPMSGEDVYPKEEPKLWPEITSGQRIMMACLTVATVVLGFYQGMVLMF